MTTPRSPFLLLAAGALAASVAFAQPGKPAPAPAKAPDTTPAPQAAPKQPDKAPAPKAPATPVEYKTADELLTALETADKKISTISSELNFTTVAGEIEGNDRQVRSGHLYFRNRTDATTSDGKPAPGSNAAAAVQFDWLIQANNKRHAEKKTYVVDGPVMLERIEKDKLVNRYRLPKGQAEQDPLKLGQGPFPLPFGQQKAEVLGRFEAELRPPLDGLTDTPQSLLTRLQTTYQLKLVPKSGAGVSSNVKEVRVWYQKKDLLPTLARIMRPDGGFDEFYLMAIQVNKPLPADIFDTTIPEGWRVEEKERP